MKEKRLYTILILVFTGIFIFSAFQIYQKLKEYEEGSSVYTDAKQYVSIEEPEGGSGEPEDNWPVVDFSALAETNSDIVAWIYIEGTEINYPIVQGTDNQYYLKHLFNNKWNSSGCIFLDSRNKSDFSNRHSIIYGHHMKNGTMFSGLTDYKEQEFYNAHPDILLMTSKQNIRVELFAGYVADVKDDAWKINFGSDTEFNEWLSEAKERSCFESKIAPVVTDRIVTFSTCSYEFKNARFVLLGVIR